MHTKPQSWYSVSQCLSFNMNKLCQAVISQHREDNMPSLCISEVQLSPKWHIDNNIHRNKRQGIPNYWQATYIYFSAFQNDKSFKLHSVSAVWRCPYQKLQAYLFVQEGLPRKYPPFCSSAGEAINQLDFLYIFFFFFFLIAPFVLHISCHCTRMGGKYGLWACNFKCRYFHLCLSSMKLNPVVQCAVIPNQEGRGGSNDLHVLTLL